MNADKLREWAVAFVASYCNRENSAEFIAKNLAVDVIALIERERLDEAKWWEHLVGDACEEAKRNGETCMYCERIAALEQASKPTA